MALAAVQIPTTVFDTICQHIRTHTRYGNMHLRETKQVKGRRTLRYLHIVRAINDRLIEGLVSGDLSCHYHIVKLQNGQTQINVLRENGNATDLRRFANKFLQALTLRVQYEQGGSIHRPRLTAEEFYIRRCAGGIPITHQTCQEALKSKRLDQHFLSQLAPWNFRLIRGRKKRGHQT